MWKHKDPEEKQDVDFEEAQQKVTLRSLSSHTETHSFFTLYSHFKSCFKVGDKHKFVVTNVISTIEEVE